MLDVWQVFAKMHALCAAVQVTNGGGGMPAWDGILDEEEIVAVANYVYDQASGNKW